MATFSIRTIRSAALALALVAVSGCSRLTGACTDDLGWRVTPQERTLRVGESFTPELTLSGCGGRERLADTITWTTGSHGVVRVEATTGRVTALTPGEATVTGRAAKYGVTGPVRVTVTAP